MREVVKRGSPFGGITAEQARAELEARERERPTDFWVQKATSAQLAFHKDESRKRCLWGGNRSGKSRVGATECIWWATGTHPLRKTPPPPVMIWAVGVDYPTIVQGIKPLYFDKLLPQNQFRWYQRDQIYECVRGRGKGSVIGLKSCDSGREKFQSTTRHLIWMDEEPPEEIFNECLARILDCQGHIMLTFTPLQGMTWSHRRLWLNSANDKTLGKHVLDTLDNPIFGGRENAEKAIKETYPGVTEEELRARLHGEYIPLSGRMVFDMARLAQLRLKATAGRKGELLNEGTEVMPKFAFRPFSESFVNAPAS